MYKKPQTAKLVDISKMNHNTFVYRVRTTIYELLKKGDAINVYNVSRWSGVSRQNIYLNDELVKLIDYYGKYVQRCTRPDNEKEYEILYSIPDLQRIEEYAEKLLEENIELNTELLRLQNKIYLLEFGFEE